VRLLSEVFSFPGGHLRIHVPAHPLCSMVPNVFIERMFFAHAYLSRKRNILHKHIGVSAMLIGLGILATLMFIAVTAVSASQR
jgi:hypothetical protein